MKTRDVFTSLREKLARAGVAEPEAKAKVIISHVLGIDYADVYSDIEVHDSDYEKIENMAYRSAAGEPVEYITGKSYFRHISLEVSPDVLIPRKETELAAGSAIGLIRKNSYRTALDVGTGSGCIAISIAAETGVKVSATDISEKALALAEKNAAVNGAAVNYFLSDMFDSVSGSYDIIVSNPPYISENEYASLDGGVRLHEPQNALTALDGLAFYRIIAKDAISHINRGGALVLEIGCTQAQSVMDMLKENGFKRIESIKDYSGRDRIICAQREL